MKAVVAGLAGIVVLSLGAVAGLAGIEAADQALSPSAPSTEALAEIPPGLVEIYQGAATACEGLPWQVIAAVFWAESRHGQGRVDPASGDVWPPIVGPALDGRPGFAAIADPSSPDGWAHAVVISGWDRALWHVSGGALRPRVIGVSAGCEARWARPGCHTRCVGSPASCRINIGRGAPCRRMTGTSRGWSSMTTSPSTPGGVPS